MPLITNELDVTTILQGYTFESLDGAIRIYADPIDGYYLEHRATEATDRYDSFNKLLLNPVITTDMLSARQARLQKRHQQLDGRLKPKPKPLPKTPGPGFHLQEGCQIIKIEVDLYRNYRKYSNPPFPDPEYYIYELIDGEVAGDIERNFVVAYRDQMYFYVDVYQNGHRLIANSHEFNDAAIKQFKDLQWYMTHELLNHKTKGKLTNRPTVPGQIYYPVRWSTGKYKSLLTKPKTVPQKEKGITKPTKPGTLRPPMNDDEWLNDPDKW
jgi:hypothetical protein